ncbi:WYL domain-containing protein [Fodinisporobacter ferrooxydans]|uniref:WYL domain-containing protein n=1 Tax=Fodinisporobacter ferrooxydans TaxID=2901836 RepID=A0ABY4CNC3_9BACL|nr:WYL domain-containing protein [Alicyclobacillaceae bacterium MYW30-H2]
MLKDLQRCLGQTVEMIYMDRHGAMSQRKVKLQSIRDDYIKAYCYTKRASRTFVIDNILAVVPVVNRRAV